MEVKKIEKKVKRLEKVIAVMLQEFSDDTMIIVDAIHIEPRDGFYKVDITIDL